MFTRVRPHNRAVRKSPVINRFDLPVKSIMKRHEIPHDSSCADIFCDIS